MNHFFALPKVVRLPYKILKRHCSCTARTSFFSERVIDIWNCLPSNAVDFTSLASFKRKFIWFFPVPCRPIVCVCQLVVLRICILFLYHFFINLFSFFSGQLLVLLSLSVLLTLCWVTFVLFTIYILSNKWLIDWLIDWNHLVRMRIYRSVEIRWGGQVYDCPMSSLFKTLYTNNYWHRSPPP